MFSKYVSYEAVNRATFNYWEPSFNIDHSGRTFRVYHTKYPAGKQPNLVVIEARDDREEMYFNTFLGKHDGECDTAQEAQPFFDRIRGSIVPGLRVPGPDLERRILHAVAEMDAGTWTGQDL